MEAGTPYQLISDLMRNAVDRVLDRLSRQRAPIWRNCPCLHGNNANRTGS